MLAIDPDACVLIANYLDEIGAALAAVGVELSDDAYLFSNDAAHARPWNPDWITTTPTRSPGSTDRPPHTSPS